MLQFAQADVEYDLGQGVVRVMKPSGCGRNVKLAYWTDKTTLYSYLNMEPITQPNQPAIGHASIQRDRNPRDVRLRRGSFHAIAPGCSASGHSARFTRRRVRRSNITVSAKVITIPTFIAGFASFKLDQEEIRNARLRIANLDLEDADMLIGADFFLSHRIYVANSQSRIYFTYNGSGPVFNLEGATSTAALPDAAAPGTAAPTPNSAAAADAGPGTPGAGPAPSSSTSPGATAIVEGGGDAGDFSRRGAAMASRHDYGHALTALSRACELASDNPEYFYQRGIVYWQTSDCDRRHGGFGSGTEAAARVS